MKNRYVTSQVLMACRSKGRRDETDIYAQLEETIAKRKLIISQWEKSFLGIRKMDIHALLAETISERKRLIREWEKLFAPKQKDVFDMADKKQLRA